MDFIAFVLLHGIVHLPRIVFLTWSVTSNKIFPGQYELVFTSTSGAANWQLYAPQIINRCSFNRLDFSDSSIRLHGKPAAIQVDPQKFIVAIFGTGINAFMKVLLPGRNW